MIQAVSTRDPKGVPRPRPAGELGRGASGYFPRFSDTDLGTEAGRDPSFATEPSLAVALQRELRRAG
jgi:hypothetical protein